MITVSEVDVALPVDIVHLKSAVISGVKLCEYLFRIHSAHS